MVNRPFPSGASRQDIEERHAPPLPGPIDMKVIESFFAPRGCDAQVFTNPVEFDFESLEGLVRSTSYVPRPDEAGFAPMIAAKRFVIGLKVRKRLPRSCSRLVTGCWA